jgi:hypothetical protein
VIERLVGERTLGAGLRRRRQVVGGENRLHSGHGQRGGGVDADHTRMRQRAEQELAEQHPVGAKVFGVPGATGDLGDKIRRRVVGADELLRHVALLEK